MSNSNPDEAQAVNEAAGTYDDVDVVLDQEPAFDSDNYHPVLAFDGEASDSLEHFVDRMRGYGVTLVMEDGSHVEAVLSRLVYDPKTERQLTEFYRVVNEDWPLIDSVPLGKLERAFVTRIQVS